MNANFMGRLATPLHPIMDNMFFETFFFFVPYRLVWDDFKKFHGERTDPDSSIDYVVPSVRTSVFNVTAVSQSRSRVRCMIILVCRRRLL